MLRRKILATILVLAVCYGSVWFVRRFATHLKPPRSEERNSQRAKGDPRAKLWIVEYMDFECLECGLAGPVIDAYLAKYPSRIYFQTRFYPLVLNHRYALKSAIYAECAARQGRFWPFHDLLFAEQERWSQSGDPDVELRRLALKSGLDLRTLDACVQVPPAKQAVLKEKEEALALGIRATPTFFLNGKAVVGLEALKRELDDYFLKRKQGVLSSV